MDVHVDADAAAAILRAARCGRAGKGHEAAQHYAAAFAADAALRGAFRVEFAAAAVDAAQHALAGCDGGDDARWAAVARAWMVCVRAAPDNDLLYGGLARAAFALGRHVEARAAFRAAAARAHGPARALHAECARRVGARLVESWHFRMVNDDARNHAFAAALGRAIAANKAQGISTAVLDIGAGTGLLSLFAARCGADRVVAVERGAAMAAVARATVARNRHEARGVVEIVEADSLELYLHDPQSFDIIVAEVVDAAVFGEGALATLADARKRLLAPGGIVIPRAASIRAVAVELAFGKAETAHGLNLRAREPYGVTTLATLRHEAASTVFRFDAIDLCGAAVGGNAQALGTGLRCDALVVWFDLHLDEFETITTAPPAYAQPSARRCESWQQAIFPLERSPVASSGASLLLRAWTEPRGRIADVLRLDFDVNGEAHRAAREWPVGCVSAGDADVSLLNDSRFCAAHSSAVAALRAARLLDVGFGTHTPTVGVGCAVQPCSGADEFTSKSDGAVPTLVALAAEIDRGAMTRYDALALCVVEPSGLLRAGALADVDLAKRFVLTSPPRIEPRAAQIIGVVVECEELALKYFVDAKSTLGFDLSPLDDYATPHGRDVDVDDLQSHGLKVLSKTLDLVSLDFLADAADDAAGDDDGPPGVERLAAVPKAVDFVASESGAAHAILFWWRLAYGDGPLLSTMPSLEDAGADPSHSHWRSAATFFDAGRGVPLRQGAACRFHVALRHSQLDVLGSIVETPR